ncbi:coiled-coil alpha-helical rod protein 1 isoform X2 [Amblyraja radiata]|uniref:coiled-coil alpha-helical rod protein 1 isoform X2 n=1 Tax=Amblyraja radiata TaxID=386614 RepID=UPI001402666F|nr:coiled-coil alpha-helical rod protein 1 isoform X2 [Amblyraja radiata]
MEERPGPGRGLEPPSTFWGKIGAQSLIPPSHFSGRSYAPSPLDSNPWAALSKATKEILELRQENEHLRRTLVPSSRRCPRVEEETACIKPRSLEQERAPETGRPADEPNGRIQTNAVLRQAAAAIAEKDALLARLGQQLRRLEGERPEGLPPAGIQLPTPRQRDRRPAGETLPEHGEQRDGATRQRDRSSGTHSQILSPDVNGCVDEDGETLRQRAAEVAEDRERLRRRVAEVEEDRERLRGRVAEVEEDRERLRGRVAELEDVRERLRRRLAELEVDGGTLRQRAAELGEELRQCREEGQREVMLSSERLDDMGRERDALQEEMSEARGKLDSQSSLIQQLRTYIGQLVPDEKQLEEARQEKEQLNNRVQHLEKERETLRSTVELLNVRLTSLTDILAIQESHRGGKPKPDIGGGDDGKKATLVTRWREKVFALMVQLKSQEISHTNDVNHLHVKIADLEEELAVKGQEHAVMGHSLQDRTAEMDLERVKNQSLGDDLACAQKTVVRLQERADQADSDLRQLQELTGSFYQKFLDQEAELRKALCQLVNLSQRVTFANKRIDTIHGLWARKEALVRLHLQERSREPGPDISRRTNEELEKELELLNGERDQLAVELKRNSQLIEKKVSEARLKFEAETKDCLAASGRLQEALAEKVQAQQRLTEQLTEAQREVEETQETAETLRRELCSQQGAYQEALQEKVAAAESLMAEQLSEMEKHLNEARREHAKAVVALRQADRQAARDKERLEACGKLQEEQHKQERQLLSGQLRQLQRDKTLLVILLQRCWTNCRL